VRALHLEPVTQDLLAEKGVARTWAELGQMLARSHERVRQILARYNLPREELLPEKAIAA
jgi:hypothetical protein